LVGFPTLIDEAHSEQYQLARSCGKNHMNLLSEPSMLNIEIDSPELEESLQQLFGNNQQSMADAFAEFIQQRKIKQDIGISIAQLNAGEGLSLRETMQSLRQPYE
jgi:type II restriction/modification system DNA methylase subunit YeeA